ncbi:MAG: hypothetical protein ACI8WB_000790 [Phenylobacterium sp.]
MNGVVFSGNLLPSTTTPLSQTPTMKFIFALITLLSLNLYANEAAKPAGQVLQTMRLDYFHSGNAKQAMFSVDEVVLEPTPWPGNPAKTIDTLPRLLP